MDDDEAMVEYVPIGHGEQVVLELAFVANE
jgi:hypothetical protein